jgi:hypothetical protein
MGWTKLLVAVLIGREISHEVHPVRDILRSTSTTIRETIGHEALVRLLIVGRYLVLPLSQIGKTS